MPERLRFAIGGGLPHDSVKFLRFLAFLLTSFPFRHFEDTVLREYALE
jgi:hypothetical protein